MSGIEPAAFQRFRQFLQQRTGIDLEDGKEYLVENRLAPLARQHDTTLAQLLRRVPGDREVVDDVIDAMTTNETSFFRDIHPFESLRTELIPEAIERNRRSRRLSILSGACSTGQEAYSIAMLIRSNFPELADWNVRIDGFDLSRFAVRRAQEGRYSQLEVNRGLPAANLRWFRQDGREFVVAEDLRRWCSFRTMNLVEPWGAMGPYDISLLRNVLIYFAIPTKVEILRRLLDVTVPGGVVILGASETTISLDVALRPERVGRTTVFRAGEPDGTDSTREGRSWTSPAMT